MVSLTSAGAALAFHYQRQPRRWLGEKSEKKIIKNVEEEVH